MKKKNTYDIGNNRLLKIAKNNSELYIEEKDSAKSAAFTPSRWASFLLCLDEIDRQLEKFAAGENVAYRNHYGGGWCVSVTSGIYCVDLRKFYLPIGETEWKPTRTGIALRLSEWTTFRNLLDVVQRDHLTVANFTPCFLNQDHTTLEGIQACRECNPYTVTPSPGAP